MGRSGMVLLLCVMCFAALSAEEPTAPGKPLGFSLSEHWYFTLGLEGGVRYTEWKWDDEEGKTGFLSTPWLPAFGFRYYSERNDFLWMNTGLLGYVRIENMYKEADLNEVQYAGLSFGASTMFSGHFLKDGPVSFGFQAGFIFVYFEGDMFMDRFALHSLWEFPPLGFTFPFQFFISGKEDSFSVTLNVSPVLTFGFIIPTTASASVRILPLLDLCYEGGVTVSTFGEGVVNWHEVGIAYQLSPQVKMKALAGYARLPIWDYREDEYEKYRLYWHNDAAFEISFDIMNAAATNKTVVGFRRMPLSYHGWADLFLADDFFLDFQDRSVVPWLLIGFNGDVAWAERISNEYQRPAMYIRFLPYIAVTFWDIITWRLAGSISFLPAYKDDESSDYPGQLFNKNIETTITIAY